MTFALTTGSASIRKVDTTLGSSSVRIQVMKRPSSSRFAKMFGTSAPTESRDDSRSQASRARCCRDPAANGGSSATIRDTPWCRQDTPWTRRTWLRPRLAATFQREDAESRDEGGPLIVPRNVRIGHIEADAVPGPVLVECGFQERETAANALPARLHKCLGGSGLLSSDFCPFRGGGTKGRRGIVECLAQKLERCGAVLAACRSASVRLSRAGSTRCVVAGFLRARESRGPRAALHPIPFRSFLWDSRADVRETRCPRLLSIRGISLRRWTSSSSMSSSPPAPGGRAFPAVESMRARVM